MSEWQPIETAPRDGDTRFLGCDASEQYWPHVYFYAGWEDENKPVWSMAGEYFTNDLTHWMPLPEPPK